MSSGDQFVWSGPQSGSWDVAANWTDTTTSEPATSPPGPDDTATIDALAPGVTQTITGSGSSAELIVDGDTALAGAFSTGELVMAGGGLASLYLNSGSSLSVSGDAVLDAGDGADWVSVSGGALTVAGSFSNGGLNAVSGGRVQVGALDNASAGVDSKSVFEVGTAGGAKAGAFTVDAGAAATPTGITAPTVTNAGTITGATGGTDLLYANQVDNTGSISGMNFHALEDNLAVNNSGTITLIGDWIPGSLVDNGVVIADPSPSGGLPNLVGSVTGTGQLQIAAGGDLMVDQAGAGITVAFAGAGGALDISSSSLDSTKTFDPKITGFAAGDVIDYAGKVTAATYNASNGVLSLADGGTVVAKLHLVGDYTGASFRTTALNGDTLISVSGGGDTSTPPAGTSTPDQYVWSGPSPGSWDVAANWTDTTTSSDPAAVAPGVHDSVTINSGGGGLPQVITGTGDAAELTVDGGTTLSGQISTGELNISGAGTVLAVQSKASLDVSGAASASAELDASGGAVKIAGTLNLNAALLATGGGKIQLGGLNAGEGSGVSVDSTSSIEVGTQGTAKAGSFTVDTGDTATLSALAISASALVNHGAITNEGGSHPLVYANTVTNTGSIYGVDFHAIGDSMSFNNSGTITLTGDWLPGSVVDDGVVIADPSTTGNDMVGQVTGTGQLQIASGSTLTTATVASGVTVAFTGSSGSLDLSSSSLDSTRTYDAKITGFAAGDAINYGGTVTSAVYKASTDVLQLLDGSTVVAKLHLAGNYTGDTFQTTPDGQFTQITVDPPAPVHNAFDFSENLGSEPPAGGSGQDSVSGGGGDPPTSNHDAPLTDTYAPPTFEAPMLTLDQHLPATMDLFTL